MFDKAVTFVIHLGQSVSARSQAYVAVSTVMSSAGVMLVRCNKSAFHKNNCAVHQENGRSCLAGLPI